MGKKGSNPPPPTLRQLIENGTNKSINVNPPPPANLKPPPPPPPPRLPKKT